MESRTVLWRVGAEGIGVKLTEVQQHCLMGLLEPLVKVYLSQCCLVGGCRERNEADCCRTVGTPAVGWCSV